MARDLIIGTSALPSADADLMRQAGIGAVRAGFAVPFADRMGGAVTEAYRKSRAQAEAWAAKGFQVMGVTPLPGICTYEADASGALHLEWQRRLPDWFGPEGSAEYCENYRAMCRWLAEDLRGIAAIWQLANELDIKHFAGPLNPRQACELVNAAARGLKEADPGLLVGHNPAGAAKAYFLYGRLYGHQEPLLDYCGVDGYYGTWQAGGPEDWSERIAELHELTGAAVLVNEWGFASAGDLAGEGELPEGAANCQIRKWRYAWGQGHTPDGQAAFVREAFRAFRSRRSALLGVFFYRWEDQEKCWQCGRADCPVETAWGLVDLRGRPKPAFHAFKEGAALLRG